MSHFKKLIEVGDAKIREEMGDYYFISKSRMDELIRNFDEQSKRIMDLSATIIQQQEQIKRLIEYNEDELTK